MSRITMDVPFAMVPEWVIKADVSAQSVRLYAALCRYANLPHGAMPGRKTLASEWMAGASLDTVDRSLKELMRVGAVTRISRSGATNEYILHSSPPDSRTRAATTQVGSRTRAQVGSRTGAARKRGIEREETPGGAAGEGGGHSREARDTMWDSLAAVFGQPATKTEKSNRGRQVRELLDAGFDPERLPEVQRNWGRRYQMATFTANALVAHLSELAPAGPRKRRIPPCPECEMGGGHHTADCSQATAGEEGEWPQGRPQLSVVRSA